MDYAEAAAAMRKAVILAWRVASSLNNWSSSSLAVKIGPEAEEPDRTPTVSTALARLAEWAPLLAAAASLAVEVVAPLQSGVVRVVRVEGASA